MSTFHNKRKCIGYKSVQHYIRRAIRNKTDHQNCDKNKSLSHWHWGRVEENGVTVEVRKVCFTGIKRKWGREKWPTIQLQIFC